MCSEGKRIPRTDAKKAVLLTMGQCHVGKPSLTVHFITASNPRLRVTVPC